jgi:hypothetical protein
LPDNLPLLPLRRRISSRRFLQQIETLPTARDVKAIADNLTAISSAVKQVSSLVATTREAAKVLAR